MRRLRTRDWLLGTSAGIVVAGLTVASQLAFADRTSAAPAPATPASSTQVPAASTVGDPPQPGGPQPLPALARVTATSVEIPAIGVRSRLEALTLDSRGVLRPPADPDQAGWYSAGPVPGDRGPAVIAGHLASFTGPAVFLRLGQLRSGDLVIVHRSDGSTVDFRVQSTRRFAKTAFPTQSVYGATPVPTLRLITCGGAYDHSKKRYPDDVVVFAEVA